MPTPKVGQLCTHCHSGWIKLNEYNRLHCNNPHCLMPVLEEKDVPESWVQGELYALPRS